MVFGCQSNLYFIFYNPFYFIIFHSSSLRFLCSIFQIFGKLEFFRSHFIWNRIMFEFSCLYIAINFFAQKIKFISDCSFSNNSHNNYYYNINDERMNLICRFNFQSLDIYSSYDSGWTIKLMCHFVFRINWVNCAVLLVTMIYFSWTNENDKLKSIWLKN